MVRFPFRLLLQAAAAITICVTMMAADPAHAVTKTVCAKSGSEFAFDSSHSSGDTTSGMKAKLSNPAYFGSGGAVAPEDIAFSTLATVDAASLANCTIFIGGGFQENLSAAEGAAILNWVNGGPDRAVIGGCDQATNQTCSIFGRTLTQFASGAGVTLTQNIAYNPLTCGGVGTVNTFGGQASAISTVASDTILATHDGGVQAGNPAATTDDLLDPTFLITADADMFANSGNEATANATDAPSGITDNPTATRPQGVFVLNVFKFTLDGLAGRSANPQCFDSYNDLADLSLTVNASNASPTIGAETVITVTVTNNELAGGSEPNDVEATIPVPAGMTFVAGSASATQGSYDNTTGTWDIGTMAAATTVTLTYRLAPVTAGSPTLLAEITNSGLPDTDSAPNSSFGTDDQDDGLADDDEGQVNFFVPQPFVCDGTLYQIATSNSTLKELTFTDTGSGYTANLTDVDSAGQQVNAGWGFNEVDDLIYGVRSGSRELWRIDSDGVFEQIVTLGASFANGSNAGDVLPNGTMVYKQNNTTWQLADISTPKSPVDLGSINLSTGLNVIDFALNPNDGMIYGVENTSNQLFYVDISGGAGPATPEFFGPSTFTGSYGAAWFDEDGRLYLYDNNSNEISIVNVGSSGSGSGNATVLAVSVDEEGGINDGAYCRGPSPVPLGSIAGTVYSDQNYDDARNGGEPGLGPDILVSLYYDNGTPADPGDDTFIDSVDTAADGSYLFDGMVTNQTYRIEVDEADPELPPNFTIGTPNPLTGVIVTANNTTAGQDFGFDPGAADLSITKTAEDAGGAPISSAQAGDTVIWVLSVTNDGNGIASNVRVSDIIPSGFTYVSDDAPPAGDTYDFALGIWLVNDILVGATETLRITTQANGSGDDTNYAEIISSSLPDPDSDPNTGRLTDDLGDGIPDDDEAAYTVSLGQGGTVLSGQVFLDNGGGGGAAHDAVRNGNEAGTTAATVAIYDGGGTLLATPPLTGNGLWSYTLPVGYSGAVTVSALPVPGVLTISEQTAALPGLSNPDPHDGSITFLPVSGASYTALDIGVVSEPSLTQDQDVGAAAGQTVLLPHVYTATTSADVTFTYSNVSVNPPNAFSAALFEDINCDGAPDTAVSTTRAVVAGETVCLISRVTVSSGAGPGAQLGYTLSATSAFTGTAKNSIAANEDTVSTGGGSQLALQKTVRNVTKGGAEGASNQGDIGDVLEYRIIMSNPGNDPAINITVNDKTPAYTVLSVPIPSPVAVASGVTCSVVTPASNTAGYAGPVEWSCPGTFPPGGTGALTFQVTISP